MPISNTESLKFTVSELNGYIKKLIADNIMLSAVFVVGEISNFKRHSTGHLYFTLKDSTSVIRCVMFRGYADKLNFTPEEGMKVLVSGSIGVYERDGSYQLYCEKLEPDGKGSLTVAFEQLKEKLRAEGIFDAHYKKKLPTFVETVAVITSPTGAVIRDIVNVSTKRFPGIHIRLLPVAVQGAQASHQIAYAIKKANDEKLGDVIIVGRGGGSLEDLWPFNEEIVARAVFASDIPIISAVGHETDFTICDFAADVRASTPSHAAEIAVQTLFDEMNSIKTAINKATKHIVNYYKYQKLLIDNLKNNRTLNNPNIFFDNRRQEIDLLTQRCENAGEIYLRNRKHDLLAVTTKLDTLNPYSVLLRGYTAVTYGESKIPLVSMKSLKSGDDISVIFQDGKVNCRVKETLRGEHNDR